MNTIRALIFYLLLAVTIIPVCCVLLLITPFTDVNRRYDIMKAWGLFMLNSLRSICGIRFEVRGMENLPDGPAVLLSKHQSAWECIFLGAYLPNRLAYVYKESLNHIPFFGWAIRSVGMLSINRKHGRSAFDVFLKKGPDFLKRGWWICLFPEGTRVPPGKSVKFKSGGARFASMTGAPVVPIALNSALCWPKNSFAKRPGTVTVVIGQPIPTEGRSARDIAAQAEAWIRKESDALLPAKYTER